MLVANSKQLVFSAWKMQKAIGAFNVHNLEILDAVMKAAAAKKSPVIVQITPATLAYFPPIYFMRLVQAAAKIYPDVPLALHLDHGKELEQIMECLELGFGSVMIDASQKDFLTNVKITKKVVKAAKHFRVAVEAEIGIMPNYKKNEKLNTVNIEQAKEFVKRTSIDFLAAPVGTCHGMKGPEGTEHINFIHLKNLFSEIKIPLVLHGASGVSFSELKRARLYGIAKVNFDTAIRKIFDNTLRKFLLGNKSEEDLRVYLNEAGKSVQKLVKGKINALYY